MKVLVTSTRTPHALAAVRSFGAKGCDVTAGDSTRLSAGKYSRHATKRLLYPPMTENPTGFVTALLNEVASNRYDLLFPTFEEIFPVARFKNLFGKFTTVLLSDYDLFIKLHHKMTLIGEAEKAGVPCPASWQPESLQTLSDLVGDIPLPAIIKLPDGNNSLGLTIVETEKELLAKYKKLARFFKLTDSRLPIIQKKIEGDLLFSMHLADHGKTVGTLIYKPLAMFPEGGGTAFYRESVRNETAEKYGEALISKLGWHGFIGFDFIIDKVDGTPYIIDANPRPNPAFQTGEAAGVDFTGMALDMTKGRSPKPNLKPVPGVRSKTLFVEIIWFAFQLLPGKNWLRRIKKAFSIFRPGKFTPDVHRKDDRLPSLIMYLYVNWFLFVINAIKPRSGGFCYGCNYNLDVAAMVDVKNIEDIAAALVANDTGSSDQ